MNWPVSLEHYLKLTSIIYSIIIFLLWNNCEIKKAKLSSPISWFKIVIKNKNCNNFSCFSPRFSVAVILEEKSLVCKLEGWPNLNINIQSQESGQNTDISRYNLHQETSLKPIWLWRSLKQQNFVIYKTKKGK